MFCLYVCTHMMAVFPAFLYCFNINIITLILYCVKPKIGLFTEWHKVIICRDFVGKEIYLSLGLGYSINLHSSYMHDIIVGTKSQ